GPYDKTYALVIDPTLTYSTYLGGSTGNDVGLGVAVDSAGSAYITGQTSSADFPHTIGPSKAPFDDVFVTKLTPAGTGIVYSTFIGGDQSEIGTPLAVRQSGNPHVVGHTPSPNLPVVHPLQPSCGRPAPPRRPPRAPGA